jgi:hypothetical protein
LPGGLGDAGCITGIGQQGGNQLSARIGDATDTAFIDSAVPSGTTCT